jgi:hypothetical protein
MAFSIVAGTATRRQLLDDGALLDVTRMGPEHRIVVPVAITADAWQACGGQLAEFATSAGDVLTGRILAAARTRAVLSRPVEMAAPSIGFIMETGPGRVLELKLTVGPGDTGDPVATIDLAGY